MENEAIKNDGSQAEERIKTNDKPWLFKKGNPGGPGRPKGKSLKEYSREYLSSLTEEERQSFLDGIPKVEIWKMAEGNPHQTTDTILELKPTPLLDALRNNISNPQDNEVKQED